MNIQPLTIQGLALQDLAGEAARRKEQGWRLVTISCVPRTDGQVDLLYHFDKDLVMETLGLQVPGRSRLPSLAPVYPGAYLVENEIQDQFGLVFDGLTPDFKGGLLLQPEARLSPLAAYSVAAKDESKMGDE